MKCKRNRPRARRTIRRRAAAFTIVYMLALLPLLMVGTMLAYRGIAYVIHANKVTAMRDHEYATLNDCIESLRRDARRAQQADWKSNSR